MTPADLIDPSALALVLGGVGLATLLRTPLADVRAALLAVVRRPVAAEVGAQLARLEQAVAARGRFAVDPALPADADLDAAARLVARGAGRAAIADQLDGQRARRMEDTARHRAMFDGAAESAPVLGLIGTVLGLMALFADGPDALSGGGGLATALTTTLYGALLATFVLSPLSARIGAKAARDEAIRLALEARLLALAEGAERPPARLVRVA